VSSLLPLPEPALVGPAGAADVVLRPWADADAGALVVAWADPEVRRWTAVPAAADLEAARRWIAGWDDRRRRRLALDLVAVDPGDGRVLGEVGLSSFDDGRSAARIGWWTTPDERGRGVATAMVSAVTAWAHDGPLGLRTLVAEVVPANAPSIAVARRVGYRLVGPPDQPEGQMGGESMDLVYASIGGPGRAHGERV